MQTYDLAIAWNWEFDHDFIFSVERECQRRNLKTYRIDEDHLPETLRLLKAGAVSFQAFFDRASDADPEFLPLVQWMEEHVVYYINPHRRVVHAVDKATMHLEFLSHGLHVPDTIILSPYHEQRELQVKEKDLQRLGVPFVIKPANTTGGGTGVKLHAAALHDVERARQEHKNDIYLLQNMIHPDMLDGKRAWFRVYYAFGDIIPCWWDDHTHRYLLLNSRDEQKFKLKGLRDCIERIQSICGLDFFSSEIAFTREQRFIVVDYVNEVCDMRLQSRFHNGAPDVVVRRITGLIAREVAHHLYPKGKQKVVRAAVT